MQTFAVSLKFFLYKINVFYFSNNSTSLFQFSLSSFVERVRMTTKETSTKSKKGFTDTSSVTTLAGCRGYDFLGRGFTLNPRRESKTLTFRRHSTSVWHSRRGYRTVQYVTEMARDHMLVTATGRKVHACHGYFTTKLCASQVVLPSIPSN